VNYLGYVARIGPRALFLILAGRFYGEGAFGLYTFGITLAETAAAVALFGLKRSLFKFMNEAEVEGRDVHGAVAHGIALAVGLAALFSVGIAAAAGLLARVFGFPGAVPALLVFTLSIPMTVTSDILLVAIRHTRQMRFEVYARSLAEPIVLTAALAGLYAAGVGAVALSIAYTLSLTVAAALSVFFFLRIFSARACARAPLHWSELRRMTGFSGPTAVYDFLYMLFDRVDVFLVSYLSPAAVVGVYGMARQFSTVTKKIRGGFDRILPAVLAGSIESRDLGKADRQLVLVSRWILTVQLLLVLFFVFFGGDLLGVLGSGFSGGALVLVLLMLGDAVQGSLGISELPFVYLRPGLNVLFGGALLALAGGLGFLLIPDFGGEGAALAVLVTVTAVNAVRIVAGVRLLGVRTADLRIVKPVLATLPAMGAVWWMERLVQLPLARLALGVPLLVVLYMGALVLMGLEPEDQAQIRRVVRRFRARG